MRRRSPRRRRAVAKAETAKAGKPKAAKLAEARIFAVETRFQQLARRAGGMPRDKALERAQSALEEAKPAYDDWLEREVAGLADLVKNVEAGQRGARLA